MTEEKHVMNMFAMTSCKEFNVLSMMVTIIICKHFISIFKKLSQDNTIHYTKIVPDKKIDMP